MKSISTQQRSAFFAWSITIGWMAIIYAFSDQPFSGRVTEHYLGPVNIPVRKLAHVTEYGVLYLLVLRAMTTTYLAAGSMAAKSFLRCYLPALAISAGYALVDEWHQSFVPGRSATVSDVLVDTTGCLIALAILWIARKKD